MATASPTSVGEGRATTGTSSMLRGRNGHVHVLAVTIHEHDDRLVLGPLVQSSPEVLDRTDRLLVDLDDHVAGADTGLRGTAALDDVPHQHALLRLEPELPGHWRRERLHRESELALARGLGRLGGRLVL